MQSLFSFQSENVFIRCADYRSTAVTKGPAMPDGAEQPADVQPLPRRSAVSTSTWAMTAQQWNLFIFYVTVTYSLS